MRLDDVVDLYRRVFGRILSRADSKASPYSRYYIAVSTPIPWKHIMTVIGGVLARLGKLDDGTAHSIPADILPPPCVRDLPRCSHDLIFMAIVLPLLMMRLFSHFFSGHRSSSVRASTFAVNALRIWGGNHALWCWKIGLTRASRLRWQRCRINFAFRLTFWLAVFRKLLLL